MNLTLVKLALIAALVIVSTGRELAAYEAANRPVVRASEYGGVYAKSVPEERFGQKGKTGVFRVGADRDTLICAYNWYANEIYMGGKGEETLIRFGLWQGGYQPQKDHLALGIYRNGKMVREYSTVDMERLGSGVSQAIPRYAVFRRRIGFRGLGGDRYVFEVEGVSGMVFSIELETGTITCSHEEPNVRQDGGSDISSTTLTISAEGKPEPDVVRSISIEKVRSLLSSELTISQLESKVGSPTVRTAGNWGNMLYTLRNKRYLVFFFKGNFVTGARFDSTEITGVSPKIYRMRVESRVRVGVPSLLIELDNDSFANIGALKKRLQTLPRDSLVEWQTSCCAQVPIAVTNDLKQFCSQLGIVLLCYPSG